MTATETIDALNDEAWQKRESDATAAIELAGRAEMLSREAGGYQRGRGWSLLTIGACALSRGDYGTAREHLSRAVELLAGCGDRDGEARASTNIGSVHYWLGEYPKALEHYHASLGIFQEIGNRSGEAMALSNIGNVHFALGEYPQALEHYQSSLGIFQETGNRSGETSALSNIGNVHCILGEYPQAVERYHASLGIFQEVGNRSGEAIVLSNIGNVHSILGEYPQALERYHASMVICQEIGNRTGETNALNNIGTVHHARGEYPQALEHHRTSLGISQEIGNRSFAARALIGLASVHNARGEFDAALVELEAAAEIARETGERTELGNAMLGLGRSYAGLDHHDAAIVSLESAIARGIELGEKRLVLEAHDLISRQHETLGNQAEALSHLRRHIELKEELLGEETRRTIHNREMSWQIALARKEAEIERLRNVELRQALDNLKSAQSTLVQSEKMASLGQLTAGIAHEINNPINFVSASVRPARRNLGQIRDAFGEMSALLASEERERIQSEFEIDENFQELDELMAGIARGAERTAEIVTGLRSFSRLDEGGRKGVNLHEGLDATLTILSGGISEGIALVREYGELPDVECYPGEINQIFLNILTNAIKAIDGEGTITVRSESSDGQVRVSISDTGSGMTAEIRSHIFEPFFTTRDVGQGRGLGLSIAWGIVEKHGGTIEVTSTPGEGSTFVVTLPIRSPVASLAGNG